MNPVTVALSVRPPLRMSVTGGVGDVVMLQVLKGMGPAKSDRVESMLDPEDRVCGKSVLTHPVKPRVLRLIPPSMNSFCETECGLPVSRHTQPPHGIAVAPRLAKRLTAPAAAPVTCTYCALGNEVPGSHNVPAVTGRVPVHDHSKTRTVGAVPPVSRSITARMSFEVRCPEKPPLHDVAVVGLSVSEAWRSSKSTWLFPL